MKLEQLEDLYRKALAQLTDAEKQLIRVLPDMARVAADPELVEIFEKHASETQAQLRRLGGLKIPAPAQKGVKSKAMAGLVAEVKDLLSDTTSDPLVRDAALVAAGQKVEAFEITSYACAHNFARLLGFHDDLAALEECFREEEKMEEVLSAMAEALNVEELESSTEFNAEDSVASRKR